MSNKKKTSKNRDYKILEETRDRTRDQNRAPVSSLLLLMTMYVERRINNSITKVTPLRPLVINSFLDLDLKDL
jgi:hypothetical protein